MHYDENALWRPLFEADSVLIQVAHGCSYNGCKFCDMYHQPFKAANRDEVLSDIKEVAHVWHIVPARIFLAGGNAFAISMEDLRFVLDTIDTYISPRPSIGCFARITDIAKKTDDELVELVERGINDISIGVETGYDPALQELNKGFDTNDILTQCRRLEKAGMTYNFFYLIGMAQKGHCVEAGRATAELFSKLHPNRIMVHTMTAFEGTELRREIEAGLYEPASEKETLREYREFITQADMDTYILGNHVSNIVPLMGDLKESRAAMLSRLHMVIEGGNESWMDEFRRDLPSI